MKDTIRLICLWKKSTHLPGFIPQCELWGDAYGEKGVPALTPELPVNLSPTLAYFG